MITYDDYEAIAAWESKVEDKVDQVRERVLDEELLLVLEELCNQPHEKDEQEFNELIKNFVLAKQGSVELLRGYIQRKVEDYIWKCAEGACEADQEC